MELDARCGRCKMETRHRITSITEGTPEKLTCIWCGSIHKFKPEHIREDESPNKAPAQRKATKASPRMASPSGFQQLMIAEKAGTIAKPYGHGVGWEAGMWVDHPSFGLGKIQRRAGKKIDVAFQSGIKTLVAM
jgi:hypothetical protein